MKKELAKTYAPKEFEERIYKDKKFENAPDMDAACAHIDERLTPYYPQMIREVTKDDILRLMEIKMQRIPDVVEVPHNQRLIHMHRCIDGIHIFLGGILPQHNPSWVTRCDINQHKDNEHYRQEGWDHHKDSLQNIFFHNYMHLLSRHSHLPLSSRIACSLCISSSTSLLPS